MAARHGDRTRLAQPVCALIEFIVVVQALAEGGARLGPEVRFRCLGRYHPPGPRERGTDVPAAEPDEPLGEWGVRHARVSPDDRLDYGDGTATGVDQPDGQLRLHE